MNNNVMRKSALMALCLTGLVTTPALASPAAAQNGSRTTQSQSDDLRAFPAPQRGQMRHVIRLPQVRDSANLKVELIVGKTMQIDCNNHRFGSQIEERTAQGWGYTYYVLDTLGPAASTLMGCPAGSKRMSFVRGAQELLVNYNSRLPLVIYAPSDVEVRYRIWRADPRETTVNPPRATPRRR